MAPSKRKSRPKKTKTTTKPEPSTSAPIVVKSNYALRSRMRLPPPPIPAKVAVAVAEKIKKKAKNVTGRTRNSPIKKKVATKTTAAPPKKSPAKKKTATKTTAAKKTTTAKTKATPKRGAGRATGWKAPKTFGGAIFGSPSSAHPGGPNAYPHGFPDRETIPMSGAALDAGNIDLCFLVDVTGSMSSYINAVRDTIHDIVREIRTQQDRDMAAADVSVKQLRFAFVGYRDISDPDQFPILKFTDDINVFRDFVNAISPGGGGDMPEDVLGGLDQLLQLDWDPMAGTRIVYHIADAPGHGPKCCQYGDSFPQSDTEGEVATQLLRSMLRNQIQYFFGRVNDSCDMMMQFFSLLYGEQIIIFDVGENAVNVAVGAIARGGLALLNPTEEAPAAAPLERQGSSIHELVHGSIKEVVKKSAIRSREADCKPFHRDWMEAETAVVEEEMEEIEEATSSPKKSSSASAEKSGSISARPRRSCTL